MNWIDSNHFDVTKIAEEVGMGFDTLKAPVAITKEVWLTCVEWTDDDSERQDYQEQDARLWDVVFTCGGTLQIKIAEFSKAGRHNYNIECVPRDGRSINAVTVHLTARPQPLGSTTWLIIDLAGSS